MPGACLLSHCALLNPRRFGALVLLTGGLIGADTDRTGSNSVGIDRIGNYQPGGDQTRFSGDFAGTPALLRCASDDGLVPASRARETTAELSRLVADVDITIEHGSDHVVTDASIEAARELLARL